MLALQQPDGGRIETAERVRLDAPREQARKQLAAKIQERANETVPYVPLGTLFLVRAYSAKVSGLPKAAVPVYWNVSKAN